MRIIIAYECRNLLCHKGSNNINFLILCLSIYKSFLSCLYSINLNILLLSIIKRRRIKIECI